MRLLIPFVLLLSVSSLSGQALDITPTPSWAICPDSTVQSTMNKYNLANGYYFLQYDQVSHYETHTFFERQRVKIVNNKGVEYFSQLNIPVDTSFQQVRFHVFNVTRLGQTEDRLADLEFRMMNHEATLEQNILTGTILVNSVLEDIRKNDVVEIAYSVIGKNPLYEGQFHEISYISGMSHMDYVTYRLIHPKEEQFYLTVTDTNVVDITRRTSGDDIVYEVVATNVLPVRLEEYMSPSTNPFNRVEVTSHEDWGSVKKWAAGVFAMDGLDTVHRPFKAFYQGNSDTLAIATRLLDYVQNDIRYTSISEGIGRLRPSHPSVVYERNYGDCKDKSLLLVYLLKQLNIEAYPALVNSYGGRRLEQYQPGPELFDHVIVKCIVDGTTYWIDPTISSQGGSFLNRSSHDFGYALVVDDLPSLERMRSDMPSRTEVYETFDLSNIDGASSLVVHTRFIGRNADLMRATLENYAARDVANQFKQAYSTIFAHVESVRDMEILDSLEDNVLHVVERYTIRDAWKLTDERKKSYALLYEPMNVYGFVSAQACDDITYPIDSDKNLSFYQHTTIKLPENSMHLPNEVNTINEVYSFRKTHKRRDQHILDIIYDFRNLKDEILPSQYKDYCINMNEDVQKVRVNLMALKGKKN